MNRRLRRAHLGVVALLAPVAIGIFAMSLATRKVIPPSAIPPSLEPTEVVMQETGRRLLRGEGINVELRGLMDQRGNRFLEFTPRTPLRVADLLAYVGPGAKDAFDQGVQLLGPVSGTRRVRYPLPSDSTATLSEIYLYSLANRSVVARANLADSTAARP